MASKEDIKNKKSRINHPSEYHFNKQTELAHFILEASEIGTWSWNIDTDEIYLDDKWFSIHGHTHDEKNTIDRNTWKSLCHPDDVLLVSKEITRHINGETNFFETEYRMKHKQGHWIWILDRGKISEFTPDGKPLIIIGSHQDITNRKEKEIELVLEEARLESLLRISQHPSSLISEMLDYALDQAITLTGSKIGYIYFYDEDTKEFTLNTWSKEVMQVCTIVEPKTIYHLEKTGIWGEVVRQRKPIISNDYTAPNEYKKGYPEGHASLLRFLSVPTFDQDRIVAVVGVANKDEEYNNSDVRQLTLMMDSVWKIVKRREAEEKLTRANRLYAVISQINQAIVLNNDRHSLFNRICQIIVEYGKFAMAWIGEPDRETQQIMPVAIAGNDNGYLSFAPKISAANVPEGYGPAGTAFRENRIFICNDIANDPSMAIWRDEALKRNFRSAIGLPLTLNGEPIASITIYSNQINFFNAEEIKLLEDVVSDISFALSAIETDLQHQETISALAESEERFRMFAESAPVGGLIYDSSGNIRFLSPRVTKMLGYTLDDTPTLDSWFLKAYPNDDYRKFASEKWFYATNESLKLGEPMQPLEFKVAGKDGKQLDIEFRAEVNPEICFVTLSDITSRKRTEHLANERMKELSAFYKLSELSEMKPFNLETFYSDFVNELPKSYQYPEVTAVRIVVGDKTFSTPNFTGKGEMLISPLIIDSRTIGHLTVMFLEEKPEEAIGPFLFEERLLTDGIAERISKLTERNYAEEQLIESETKFRSLVNQMQVGLAVHEIILDKNGEPTDYRFIDVNPSFELLTGLKQKDIVGKTVLEILPNTEKIWIEKFGQVALTGQPVTFENYAQELNRYYSVTAYQPRPMQFAVLTEDITKYKLALKDLENSNKKFQFLSQAATKMLSMESLDELYRYITTSLHQQYPNAVILFLLADEDQNKSWLIDIKGVNSKLFEKTIQIAGFDFTKLEFSILPSHIGLFKSGRLHLFDKGLAEFAGPQFPKTAAKTIEKLLGINQIYTIGINKGERLYATIHFLNKGAAINENEYIESFVKQAGILIERAKTSEQLAQSEMKFRSVFNSTNEAIFIHEPNTGKIIDCNHAAEDMYGYTKDEFFDLNISHYSAPGEEYSTKKGLEMIRQTNNHESYTFEWRNKRKDGTLFWNEISVRKAYIDNKEQVIAVCRNIDDRKKILEELKESEEQHRLMFETSQEGIVISQNYRLVYFNPRMLELTGYKATELQDIEFLKIIDPLDHERLLRNYKSRVEGKVAEQNYEFRLLRKNGKSHWVRMSGVRLMWNGKPATFNFISDINDQKEADLQLLESEEKYRLIAENSSDVIWVFNTHTRKITYISPAIKKLRGYTAEEAMKHTIKELVTNETYEEVEEQIKKQISLFNIDPINNNSFTLELLQPCKDGRVINVEASLNYSFNKFNEIEILGVSRNIDERKRILAELRNSEHKFKLLFENSPLGIYIANTDGQIEDANQALLKILGSPSLKMTKGINVLQFKPLVDNGYAYHFKKSIEENRVVTIELPYTTFWGKELHLSNYIVPMSNAEGKVEKVYTLMEDITQRKNDERELIKLSLVAEQSPVSIVITNTKGTIEYVNPKFTEVTGYTAEEAIDQNPRMLKGGTTPKEEYKKLWDTILSGNEWEGVFYNRKKNGEKYWEKATIRPIKNDSGEIISLLAMKEDITKQREAQEALVRSEARLREALATKDKFFSIISHDLRSPFASIVSFSDLMADQNYTFSVDEYRQYALSLNKTAKSAYTMLENLLEWSRIQRGSVKFTPERITLQAFFNRCEESTLEAARKKSIEIVIQYSENYEFTTDKNMLHTVIRNLVNNAIKFSSPGGKITITAERSQLGQMLFSVNDTGIGMDAERLEKLFRIDTNVSRPGTQGEASSGLGLILCKEFVEKMGGTIWAESTEGIGSTFFFTIQQPHS